MGSTIRKFNKYARVHCICAGIQYGNGEVTFYDHFRRAWLSLEESLAKVPVIGSGTNLVPTIHVLDLAR